MESLIQQVIEEQKSQPEQAVQLETPTTEPESQPAASETPAVEVETKPAASETLIVEAETKPTVSETPIVEAEKSEPEETAQLEAPATEKNQLETVQQEPKAEALPSSSEVKQTAEFTAPKEVVKAAEPLSVFNRPVQNSTPKEQGVVRDINKEVFETFGVELRGSRIVVVGCGGAGNNTVNRLSSMGIKGAKTVAINTDARHLARIKADNRILIGRDLTRGLGAGGHPEVGKKAAEETGSEIKRLLKDADMVYVLAGLGGGTGTGSAPIVAKYAKEAGAIVIGAVTMPFKIEGTRQIKAEDGLTALRQVCDTTIVVENDKLLKVAGDLPLDQAFGVADSLFATMIKGITETIAEPSLVNLDYADVKTIMHAGGVATIGFGECDTNNRAEEAIVKALSNPLLDVDYTGGTGALLHITGGPDLKLDEVNLIGEYVSKQLDSEAQVIWGTRVDPDFHGKIRVITIITGVKSPYIVGPVKQQAQPAESYSPELGIKVFS